MGRIRRSEGPALNSRGRQAVVQIKLEVRSAEGAALTPNIPFVVFDLMPLKQFDELALEIRRR